MKNKVKLKKLLLFIGCLIFSCSIIFFFIHKYEYNEYRKNYNNKISSIVFILKEKYPLISEIEIVNVLNSKDYSYDFSKYGIDFSDSIILENDLVYNKFIIVDICFLIVSFLFLLIVFFVFNKKRNKEINKITKSIERINNKDFSLTIDDLSEDELSILKSEIYKVTVMLKEEALAHKNSKLELKKSLSDISHQLKTPLTSILIMVDNLLDDETDSLKIDFLRDIKREILNINFLVGALLKISKLDSDSVSFSKKKVLLNDIIKTSISNVSVLCDLKNVVVLFSETDITLNVDFKWQVEAITNILKNCVEHSFSDSSISIEVSSNNISSTIKIIDSGEGISRVDLPHIFERFYKASNSKDDSIGIGLALAKSIILKDNGSVSVKSSDKGTIFTIKYYK